MRKLLLGCLLSGALLVTPLRAQQSRWQNLDQIKPGNKVQVVEQSLKSTTGKFVRFSETDLTLTSNGQEIVIAKQQVYRVSNLGKSRKRNTLIGLGAGAAVGLGTGLAIMERETGFGGAVAGLTVLDAGVGAGIGALMPAAKEIYRGEAVPRTAGSASAQKRPDEGKRDGGASPQPDPHSEPRTK